MRRMTVLIMAAAILLASVPKTGHTIPAFARKYGFNCNMCHLAFTELNDFGQRLRDNGYQLPGQEGLEKNVFEIAPPISLRTSGGLYLAHNPAGKVTTSGFHLNGLDLLAAGVLHKNVSMLLIYTPRIDEPAADYTGNIGGMNPSQFGALESASIVFANLIPDALSLRVGRFEPAYHAFSSKRSFYMLQPYEVYTFGTPHNNFVFEDNQIGVEATGHFRNGFKYGVGLVNGTGASGDNNNAKDIYANLFKTFGRGDGLTSGQRAGCFAYIGWQPTYVAATAAGPTGDNDGKHNRPFYRLGADASLNWRTFNLKALLMYGSDDKQLNLLKQGKNYSFTGGFARLDWAGLVNNRIITSAMFNWVRPPSYDKEKRVSAVSALIRYYLGDWTAVNVALHGEYTYKQTGKINPDKQHQFAALVDFDF